MKRFAASAVVWSLAVCCGLPRVAGAKTAATEIDWQQSSALTDSSIVKKNFWRAASEITGLNGAIWFFDRYIREGGTNPGFRIGLHSWAENLKNGFEWDDNNFGTNQFAHPFHGSLYFNSARSNGYDFWESSAFAFAGSLQWEFFGEVHHPAMNDWVATSIGGTALGEMAHRMGKLIRDNRTTGSSRRWHELGGMMVDPVGGLNRIFDGEWGRVHANSPDRVPGSFRAEMNVGLRNLADERLWSSVDTATAYFDFSFDYGDPFFGDMESPYDHFNLDLQVNMGDSSPIGRIDLNGMLWASYLAETPAASHILGVFHHYDFVNNSRFKFGAQSIGAGLLSRYETGHGLEVRTGVHLNAIVLGATLSDKLTFTGREYDYGPGIGAEFEVEFGANGWHFLRMTHEQYLIHTVNGVDADHLITVTHAALTVPITAEFGAGFEYVLFTQDDRYQDFRDQSTRSPQIRFYGTMLLN